MNEANQTQEYEKETTQNVYLTISPPQLIQYLQNLDQRIEEEWKREIHEQFRNVRCFQNILGTSTSFKLMDNRSFFGNSGAIIHPQSLGSLPIKAYPTSAPNTWAMSLHNEMEPAFLSYVSHFNDITVFCPEVQEPIGRIQRRKADGEADIFCLANNKTFTMKNMESDTPRSMSLMDKTFGSSIKFWVYIYREKDRRRRRGKIIDSHGRLVAAASVSQWRERSKYTTTTHLTQFKFEIQNCLSEPTKVMLFVCFANWAKWTNDVVCKKNRKRKLITLLIVIKILLFITLIFNIYRN